MPCCHCSQGQGDPSTGPQPPNNPSSTEIQSASGIPSDINIAWLTEVLYASNLLADTILNTPTTLQDIRSASQVGPEVPRIELERSLGGAILESVAEVVPMELENDDGDWRNHPLTQESHERMARLANELKRRLRLKLAHVFAVEEESETSETVEGGENPHAS